MRSQRSRQWIQAILPAIVLCLLCTAAKPAEIVNFPDKNLEDAIRKAINKPTGDIQDIDLVGSKRNPPWKAE